MITCHQRSKICPYLSCELQVCLAVNAYYIHINDLISASCSYRESVDKRHIGPANEDHVKDPTLR